MEKETGNGLVTGLLVGAAIGIGLGLLYAPRPGRETREMLRQRAEDIRCRTEALGDDVRERVGEFGDTVKERVGNVRHAIKGNGSGTVAT
jgi:gas vesicle protein